MSWMEILWSQESIDCLMDIEDYIAGDDPERAASFVEEIIEQVETQLPGNPRMGRMVPEVSRAEIREIIYRRYRIVYRVDSDRLTVLTVFPCQRQLRHSDVP
jgi:plasmid stabilization system protein ParE